MLKLPSWKSSANQRLSQPVKFLRDFGQSLVDQLLNGPGAASPEALMSQAPAGGKPFQETYEEIVNKIREKIVINRIARVAGPVGSYVHHDFKTGVLFTAKGKASNPEVLRDVAMHIAALRPAVTTVEELDQTLVQAERERLTAEAKASGKPDNIIARSLMVV